MPDREPKRETADPLIEEVRAVRKALCDDLDNDLDKLCDFLAEIESRHAGRVVRPRKAAEEGSS